MEGDISFLNAQADTHKLVRNEICLLGSLTKCYLLTQWLCQVQSYVNCVALQPMCVIKTSRPVVNTPWNGHAGNVRYFRTEIFNAGIFL